MNLEALEDHRRLIERFRDSLGAENVLEYRIPRAKRIFITVKAEKLRDSVKYLVEKEGFRHITTISGVDVGDGMEVIYHLKSKGTVLSLRVKIPMKDPTLPTITDILSGAVFYEREVHDLLGILFKGHPDPSPLILPGGWPPNVHPLLKKWKLEDVRKRLMEVR